MREHADLLVRRLLEGISLDPRVTAGAKFTPTRCLGKIISSILTSVGDPADPGSSARTLVLSPEPSSHQQGALVR